MAETRERPPIDVFGQDRACQRRAPSRCNARRRRLPASTTADNASSGQIEPPPILCVFSKHWSECAKRTKFDWHCIGTMTIAAYIRFLHNLLKLLARLEGFEPQTPKFVVWVVPCRGLLNSPNYKMCL